MKYIVIGASAAGISAAETIRKLDSRNEVIVVSADEKIYSRCMLHHVIAGKRSIDSISFIHKDFFEKNAIQWMKGMKVTDILFDKQEIILQDGKNISYDRLLIATGSKAFLPPIKGLDNARNVFKLRDISDVNEILEVAKNAKSALIIGAGLVGLDAASGLMERGLQVSIVEMADRVLPLQLDYQAANNYQKLFEQSGVKVYTGVSVSEAVTDMDGQIRSVRLNNSMEVECDIIVAAAGVMPDIDFIKENTLKIDRGIVVNDQMKTSVQHVFAAGDVTGQSAIWPNAVKQGIVAAYNMTGMEKHIHDFFTAKNTINLLGLETVSLGFVDAPDLTYSVDTINKNGIYKKIIYKDGIVYGIILQKDIARCGFWTHVIKEKLKINSSQKNIFNLSYADFFEIDKDGNYKYASV